MPIGAYGSINVRRRGRSMVAEARVRDEDGRLRQIRVAGPTAARLELLRRSGAARPRRGHQAELPRHPEDALQGQSLHHRRDEAIVRLMVETAIRAGEVVTLQTGDLDLAGGLVTIQRGKGGKGRVIPIGPATTLALSRYLTLRQLHPRAESVDLWLGGHGKSFGYDGLGRALRKRAKRAGIEGFRPHRLRHTAAHRWLAQGGSESGLMAIAGWTRTDMLVRYTRARASERAAQEAWRLNLGDL